MQFERPSMAFGAVQGRSVLPVAPNLLPDPRLVTGLAGLARINAAAGRFVIPSLLWAGTAVRWCRRPASDWVASDALDLLPRLCVRPNALTDAAPFNGRSGLIESRRR